MTDRMSRRTEPRTLKAIFLRRLKKLDDVARLLPEPSRTHIRSSLSALRIEAKARIPEYGR